MKNLFLGLAILPMVGCAAISPQLGFDDVQSQFSSRLGGSQSLSWASNETEALQLHHQIDTILAQPLTADSATQIALLSNQSLQAEYQRLGIAQAELVLASQINNPVLDADIRFLDGGTDIELGLVQNILHLFSLPQRRKVSSSAFEEAKLVLLQHALRLVTDVQLAFVDYQACVQTRELLQTAVEASLASSELAQRMHTAGNLNELELARVRSETESLQLEILEKDAAVLEARERLNQLLGLSSEQLHWSAPPKLPKPAIWEPNSSELVSKTLANNVELAIAKQEIETLALSAGLTKKFQYFEHIELGASASKDGASRWGFGPLLEIPLPIFSQGQALVFGKESALREKTERYVALQLKIQSTLRALEGTYRLANTKLQHMTTRVLPIHEKLMNEYQKHYNAMFVGGFELLDAKRRQIGAGQTYVATLKEYWTARIKLEALLNGSLHD